MRKAAASGWHGHVERRQYLDRGIEFKKNRQKKKTIEEFVTMKLRKKAKDIGRTKNQFFPLQNEWHIEHEN